LSSFEVHGFSVAHLHEGNLVADHLAQDGFVLVRQFFTSDEVDRLNDAVSEIELLIDDRALRDPALRVVQERLDYSQLAASDVTSVDVRGRAAAYDGGMVDIFNPRIWLKRRHPELEPVLDRLQSGAILRLVQKIEPRMQPRHTNIYIHNAVTKPRVAHVDANRDFFKIFVALTDHNAKGCGPLLVYPGSHRNRLLNKIMCFYNAKLRPVNGVLNVDDASFYDSRKMVPLLMQPGDIALCNQSIVHSARPAADNGYRRTFVQVFDIPRGVN
jgi:hypothetical protein